MLAGVDPQILIGVFCAIGGGIMLLIGIMTRKTDKTQLYLKRCKEQINAIIDGFDDRNYIQRKQRENYHYEKQTRTKTNVITYTTPIVKFTAVDGKTYRVTYIRPIEKKLSLGQNIKISYNPHNPYEIFIHGDKRMKVSSTTSIETGLILLVIGIVFIFVL